MRAKKLLTLIFFSAVCFGVGAKAAKKEVKPALHPAQTEEVKNGCHCHHHGSPFGRHFTKTQGNYESVGDKDLYVVSFEDDTFAVYKKGVTDMEGIASDKEVTIIKFVNE